MKQKIIKTYSERLVCHLNRRDFLRIPAITSGILVGSAFFPPLVRIAFADSEEMDMGLQGHVRIGFWKITLPIPSFIIKKMMSAGVKRARKKVQRFSDVKKKIHHFAVRELPKLGEPISLKYIARELEQPMEAVNKLVDELEKEKTFLFRNNSDHINWAYPVTVEKTPHHVAFSTGERIHAA